MGCNSTKQAVAPSKATPEEGAGALTETGPGGPKDNETPINTLTVASAEERALTRCKLIFESFDANEDGTVDTAELVAGLDEAVDLGSLIKEAGLNPGYKALEQVRVTWDEFYANMKQVAADAAERRADAMELLADEKALHQLRKLFERIDANGDAAVGRSELASALNQDESISKLVEAAGFNSNFYVLEQLDTNSDERITWEEFEAHLRCAARQEVEEKGDVAAAVVLEQQNLAEAKEDLDEVIVVPTSIWCCAGQ